MSELRPYAGSAALERPVVELTAPNWQARATVRYIAGLRGRAAERPWAVSVSWTGPRMPGFAAGAPDGESADLMLVDELALARELAQRAIDDIRALRVPDLRALHRRLSSRH